jgi:hypothetical protein
LKRRYDFVFFDSPPIMGVSDAVVLASEVDISLQVIQYRKYPQAMTIRAKQMVSKVGGSLVGIVLNNINMSQDKNYYYYSGAATTTTSPPRATTKRIRTRTRRRARRRQDPALQEAAPATARWSSRSEQAKDEDDHGIREFRLVGDGGAFAGVAGVGGLGAGCGGGAGGGSNEATGAAPAGRPWRVRPPDRGGIRAPEYSDKLREGDLVSVMFSGNPAPPVEQEERIKEDGRSTCSPWVPSVPRD